MENTPESADEPKGVDAAQHIKYWRAIIFEVIIILLAAILAGILVYWSFSSEGFVLFAFHPALESLGMVLFMATAIYMCSSQFLSRPEPQPSKIRNFLHWLLNTISVFAIAVGVLIITWNKFLMDQHHFETAHAIVGLSSFISMCLTVALGAASNSPKHRQNIALKLIYLSFGLLTYWLGAASLMLGFLKEDQSNGKFSVALIAILAFWFIVSWKPLEDFCNRLQNACQSRNMIA